MSRAAARALAVALVLSSARALAERSDADATRSTPLLIRLAPTAEALHAERSARLERRLVAALSTYPTVERAEVLLDLPLAATAALDRPLPPAHATVLLTRRGPAPTRAEVFTLLHASIPTLRATDLTLIEQAPAPVSLPAASAPMVSVGPFRVAPDSAARLRWALAVSLAVHALFAAIVLWRLRLPRSVARKVDPRARTPFPP